MASVNDKETSTEHSGRRKFLLRAGLGSLPVLLTLKSKAAWGTSTLNCSLSETASQMQSVQPDKFVQCETTFKSHGSAKLYFEAHKAGAGDGKGAYFWHYGGAWDKQWGLIDINQYTKFNMVFGSGYQGTLKQAVSLKGGFPLIRNIAALFLHSLFYQREGIATNIPSADQIVAAYKAVKTQEEQKKLSDLLVYYIDGY